MKLDNGAIKELRETQDRIGAVWPDEAANILSERNPDLLSELGRLERVMDSLLVLPVWPAPIKKQWKQTLSEYEKTAMLCVQYAKRHLQLSQGK